MNKHNLFFTGEDNIWLSRHESPDGPSLDEIAFTITSGQTSSSPTQTTTGTTTATHENTPSTSHQNEPSSTTSQENPQSNTNPAASTNPTTSSHVSSFPPTDSSASLSDITRTYIPSGSQTSNTGLGPLLSTASAGSIPSSQSTTSGFSENKKSPIGAIIGGVLGGLAILGLLIALLVFLCRRRREPTPQNPTLVPLNHDDNYVQPALKSSRLVQISSEKEAAQQQREALQTEMERIDTSVRMQGAPLVDSNAPSGSGSGLEEQQNEALRQRILELELQQRHLEDQLYDSRLSPPGYSD
ncbi:hypothetical protein H0H87_010531 [Tephrocybe sp. NHM501043]|nr:hypothetical protein H0H87_010531 [Tephrocybe sp. NHM501043]